MKISPRAPLLALALSAGLTQALGQGFTPSAERERLDKIKGVGAPPAPILEHPADVPRPPGHAVRPEPESAMLSVNYRIAITATENGKKLGELTALTCSSDFQMDGNLDKRSGAEPAGAGLSVKGALAEQEGGTLKLSYDIGISSPVPIQTMSMPGGGPSLWSTHSYKRTGGSGMLLLKPGQSYEVMTLSGIVYAVSIAPTETPPAPKLRDDASAAPGQPAGDLRPEKSRPTAAENEESRKHYEALSDSAKEKFRDAMTERFRDEKFRGAPEDERRATIKQIFEKIEAEDKATPQTKPRDAAASAAPGQPTEGVRPESRRPSDDPRRGPSDEDRRRYESLSENAKDKFREAIRETFSHEEFRNAPEEERRATIKKLFEKAEAEDKAAKK